MPFANSDRQAKPNEPQGARLDGWKEIASYLHRGERTVKRWESECDLPIHRVPNAVHGRVYARTAELDEWLASRVEAELDCAAEATEIEPDGPHNARESHDGSESSHLVTSISGTSTSGTSSHRRRRTWALAASAAFLAALALYSAIRFEVSPSKAKPGSLQSAASRSEASGLVTSTEVERRTAHELCLKGRFEWNYRTPYSLRRALDDFTQAVVHDSTSTEAYVGLADTYILLREYSTLAENDAYAQAQVAARKALSIDEASEEGHRALAFVLTNGNWDFVSGEREFRRAIELNPSDPVVRRWYANAFAIPGHMNESLEQMDKAQELDPTSNATLADKGLLLYKAGRIAEGIDLLKQVERTDPAFRSPHFYLMTISFAQHDYRTFLTEARKTAEAENDPVLRDIVATAAVAYQRGGERAFLEALYGIQKKDYREGRLLGMMLAKTCIAMGRRKEALAILEQEYTRHSPIFLWCLSDPDLLTLRHEPRYLQVVRNINFPWPPKDTKPSPIQTTNPDAVTAVNGSPS